MTQKPQTPKIFGVYTVPLPQLLRPFCGLRTHSKVEPKHIQQNEDGRQIECVLDDTQAPSASSMYTSALEKA